MKPFESFEAFYPYYLSEHRNGTCRVLHVCGSLTVLALVATAVVGRRPMLLLWCPLVGYGAAWIGHFLFEKNRPATFTYPAWSFMGDFVMLKDVLIGRVPLLGTLPPSFYAEQIKPYVEAPGSET